jgi:hypothetical protein
MHPDRSIPRFLRLLTDLRWLAVAGQPIAIVAAISGVGMPFAPGPLWAGVLVLLLFNLWAQWRCHRAAAAAGPVELALHLAVDLGVLTWQLYWSAGTANPFVSLYLVGGGGGSRGLRGLSGAGPVRTGLAAHAWRARAAARPASVGHGRELPAQRPAVHRRAALSGGHAGRA